MDNKFIAPNLKAVNGTIPNLLGGFPLASDAIIQYSLRPRTVYSETWNNGATLTIDEFGEVNITSSDD